MDRNTSVRPAAVAGMFYPDDAAELRDVVSAFLASASVKSLPGDAKAFIVPHAGYVYSGATAADAYVHLAKRASSIRRVVLIGPSHRVYLQGVAMPEAEAFATPLGEVPIDAELRTALRGHTGVAEADQPHRWEHSLEVQLPFLQAVLNEFTILPLVTGAAPASLIGAILEEAGQHDDTVIIASSDLSHYHSYATARQIDAATSSTILRRDPVLSGEQACGAVAINGLLAAARSQNLLVEELSRCNSGDTAGDRERVVGYGAYALHAA